MTTDRQIVDMIEQAHDKKPFCACGRHTTPVERDGVVWLECASLGDAKGGRLARLVAALTAPSHTRVAIVDVPTFQPDRALVGWS